MAEQYQPLITEAVTLVGVGGIGAQLVRPLARMGAPNLVLHDADRYAHENLHSQDLCDATAFGRYKVTVAKNAVRRINPHMSVTAIRKLVTADVVLATPIVISGVDSNQAREEIWKAVRKSSAVLFYIDARLSNVYPTYHKIFFVYPHVDSDVAVYESWLEAYRSGKQEGSKILPYQHWVSVKLLIAARIAASLQSRATGGPLQDWETRNG